MSQNKAEKEIITWTAVHKIVKSGTIWLASDLAESGAF